MMKSPTVDIIVPVWNSPFETRACLAAILEHSPEARLIIVDNGSSRETEIMLEEFSEPLGERGLFIKTERNVGLVPAINMGLARSDSDYAVIVRPHVMVNAGWLKVLLDVAESTGAGIVSPLFRGAGAPQLAALVPGCTVMESCKVSLATLLLRGEMRVLTGTFNDGLDGGEWCLNEYVRRVASGGYRTCITSRAILMCDVEPVFGSQERRLEMQQNSRLAYLSAWGLPRHYVVYFGKEADAASLGDFIEVALDGARQGHRFTLLLHRRQYSDFRRMGWNGLHTGIELNGISLLFPQRDLQRQMSLLKTGSPDLLAVRGSESAAFPALETAISLDELIQTITKHSTCLSAQLREESP
ncbi:MAG: glycosyltransferase [Deltaproteobacteria bacterium]|nr:glycosyltransferase [Deltaproteobacteria bacterium]